MNKIGLRHVFLFGAFFFVFGLIYGIAFAFPSPDFTSGKVNESISFLSLSVGVVLIEIFIIGGMTRFIFHYFSTSISAIFTGMFLVVSSCIYGAKFAFPLPNPPDGLLWVFHTFFSITLFLVGLLSLLLVWFEKLKANKALQRASR